MRKLRIHRRATIERLSSHADASRVSRLSRQHSAVSSQRSSALVSRASSGREVSRSTPRRSAHAQDSATNLYNFSPCTVTTTCDTLTCVTLTVHDHVARPVYVRSGTSSRRCDLHGGPSSVHVFCSNRCIVSIAPLDHATQ